MEAGIEKGLSLTFIYFTLAFFSFGFRFHKVESHEFREIEQTKELNLRGTLKK